MCLSVLLFQPLGVIVNEPKEFVDEIGALKPDDETHRRARKRIEENLRQALLHDPDSLIRRQELGDKFALLELNGMIRVIREYLSRLQEANSYYLIGPKRLEQVANLVEQSRILLDDIAKFEPSDNDKRGELRQRCEAIWNDCSLFQPYLGYEAAWADSVRLLPQHVDTELKQIRSDLAEEVRKLSHDWEEEGKAKLAQVDAALTRVELVEAAVRAAAEQAGINAQAKFFQAEARHHDMLSIVWLIALLATGATTVYYMVVWLEPQLIEVARTAQRKNEPLHVIVVTTVSRVAMLSLLWFVVLWCARNFNAHRHNVVVNRHRQNAISSFRAFAEGDQIDPATKNAILLSATQSVFAPQSTGYLKGESDVSQSPTGQIIEIVRGVATGKSKD